MRSNVILTLTGKDRIGIVEEVTKLLVDLGGNGETSRMARLGGEFAILMLVTLPGGQLVNLEKNIKKFTAQGYKVTLSQTGPLVEAHPGWLPYQIEVHGTDHEGIVHEISHHLSKHGINIETMDAETSKAPISGTPLIHMKALVVVPPELKGHDWQTELQKIGHRLSVEVNVTSMTKD